MYHSITFGEKNTWDDWHLIPTSRPVFNPPPTETHMIKIPGANGVLDLSESLTGYPIYENRTGSIEFIVENGHERWDIAYSDIMDYIHGKQMRAILEDDKAYYYEGRFYVNQWKSDKSYSLITIDYDVYPYKRELFSSTEDWLWDTFDFETGIIRNYKDIELHGNTEIILSGSREPVTPIVIVKDIQGGVTLPVMVNNGETIYNLIKGENIEPAFIIKDMDVKLLFLGWGTVSIEYRGGRL